MKYHITDFGGVLVRTRCGDIAVNAGALPKVLRAEYLRAGEGLRALVVTSELFVRTDGAAAFAEEANVPLIASLIVSAFRRDFTSGGRRPITFLPPAGVTVAGARLDFHLLGGDSVDPVYLTIEADGRRLGIVPDGRLDAKTVRPLLECDEVLLGNGLDLPPEAPGRLARQLRWASNTNAELDALFRGYAGKLVRF